MSRIPILRTVSELRSWRLSLFKASKSLGLVPTMGALHEGHMALLTQSIKRDDATVLSIFVNPSQFAPHEDLEAYPRDINTDVHSIEVCVAESEKKGHTLAIFAPTVKEMYPSGITLHRDRQLGAFVDVAGFGHQLEGSIRPHFFRGVATVVTKLLFATLPERAYFGQKDMQQCAVVKRLLKDLLVPTELVVGETIREPSGLAMSSRNAYLPADIREKAGVLYHALVASRTEFQSGVKDFAILYEHLTTALMSSPIISDIEYISLNDPDTLESLNEAKEGTVISMAVGINAGSSRIRLIDNIIL